MSSNRIVQSRGFRTHWAFRPQRRQDREKRTTCCVWRSKRQLACFTVCNDVSYCLLFDFAWNEFSPKPIRVGSGEYRCGIDTHSNTLIVYDKYGFKMYNESESEFKKGKGFDWNDTCQFIREI